MRGSRLAFLVAALLAVGGLAWANANDPGYPKQWALPLIGADEAWKRACGAGAVVAVVDTGVDLDHQDLLGRVVAGRDFVDHDDLPQDANGHGTHVAGIVAATTGNGAGVAGVAPQASIMPLRVLDAEGRGDIEDVDAAIRWAADNGAEVINLSLGPDGDLPISQLVSALSYAWQRGAIPVLAAGDTKTGGTNTGDSPVIVVTATTASDQLAAYATGVGDARWAMAAPGGQGEPFPVSEWILSSYFDPANPSRQDAYAYLSGTSQAAPHVAGAAAVLRGAGLSPQATVDRLLGTARDLGAPGRDPQYGSGRLDLGAATAGVKGVPCPFSAAGSTNPTTSSPPSTSPRPAGGTTTTGPPRTTTTAGSPTTTALAPPSTIARRDPPRLQPGDDGVVLADLDDGGGGGRPSRWPAALPASALAGGAGYLAWRQRGLLPASVLARLPAGD